MKYLFFDTETGGLSTYHSLLEVYLGVYDEKFNLLTDLHFKLKPNEGEMYTIMAKALEVNKIDLIAHSKSAVEYDRAKPLLKEFLSKNSNEGKEKLIPVGQNVGFDIEFVTEYLMDKAEFEKLVTHRKIDIASIGRFLQIAGKIPADLSGSLTSYSKYYNIDITGAHSAKVDVKLTVEVLKRFLETI